VDYEGLTTLNISATQELSKLLKTQQAAIDAQDKKIAQLTQLVNALRETRIVALEAKK
jgi:Asp-tRNA(Asn)/Glu-tRNA(Gln) amidotransferase B subunit